MFRFQKNSKKVKLSELPVGNKKIKIQLKIASRDQRIVNSLIDGMPIFVLLYLITGSLNMSTLNFIVINVVIVFFYYFIFEMLFSKTPAKFLTKTKVITKNGNSINYKVIFLRTLIRLIPFEGISFLFVQHPIGLHDKLSGTLVIDESSGSGITKPWLNKIGIILKIILYIFLALMLLLFLLLIGFMIKSWLTGSI